MNHIHDDKFWELITTQIHKESDSEETEQLKQILNDKNKQNIFLRLNDLYSKLSRTKFLEKVSIDHSWNTITKYITSKQRRIYFSVFKYAAIVLIAILVGTMINDTKKIQPEEPAMFTEIYVPLGQMSEMTLYDGTHVWLNSGTKLIYPNNFGKETREVKLEGEAFFKVNPGEIPFKVQIKNNTIEVLGTSFSAIAYPEDNYSQVTLIEGAIIIKDKADNKLAEMEPRQQINIPEDSNSEASLKLVDTRFYESWIEGMIQFDDEQLSEVARRLERWYNVQIIFTSKAASNLRFSGTVLKSKPIDQSMKAMSLLLPIKVEYQNNLANKDVITISIK